jgi:hypothetical protein
MSDGSIFDVDQLPVEGALDLATTLSVGW